MNKTRQSNLELLRILLAMMVIVLHFNIPGANAIGLAANNLLNKEILHILESLSICAVNVFVIITGYFMCVSKSIKISKVICLLIQVSIFNLLIYFFKIYLGNEVFSIGRIIIHLLPNNWYTSIYIALYLISPYINKLINDISKQNFEFLLILSMILFSVSPFLLNIIQNFLGWNTEGLSFITIEGDINGYTIINFIFLYLIGAYIKLFGINKIKYPYIIYLLFAICIYLGEKLFYGYSTVFYDYSNPFIILEAIALFLTFEKLNIKYNKFINILSSQSLSVYLLHANFYILFNVKNIVASNPFILFIWVFIVCVTLYLISWLIGSIYNLISKPILKHLIKKDFIIEIE